METLMNKNYSGRVATSDRPTDEVISGGNKNEQLPEIIPFVAKHLNANSAEDMRLDLEGQLRELGDVTRSISIAMRKLEERIAALEKPTP